jgi:translation initiation factor 1
MPKKKLYNQSGIVYSTAENFNPGNEEEVEGIAPKAEQKLTITLDVKGFSMKDPEINDLAKSLRSFCGSGGSAKNSEIIIQGDHREKILQWLLKNGYPKSRKI